MPETKGNGNGHGATDALLEIRDVDAHYGQIQALRGLSIAVRRGEIVTLLGANGAGKTTTLRSISGLVRPTTGAIFFEGQPIDRWTPSRIVGNGISHVPEGRQIFAGLTVLENLRLGTYPRKDKGAIAADLARVYDLFPRLRERLKQKAGTLSGGEQQMLAIGRGLMANPRLLLLDEPSLGLAPRLVQEIFKIVRAINETGTTVLIVEQNANMALSIAHRGYVLITGRVALADTSDRLRENEDVKRSYLGH